MYSVMPSGMPQQTRNGRKYRRQRRRDRKNKKNASEM
jgi:hypothetical protein